MVARDERSANAPARPRYKNHRAVDDRCGVATAVETTPGHIRDGNCLAALVEQQQLIVRSDGHELLLTGWAQAETPQAERDRRRRMTLIEEIFGQAAQNHHFKRARYRRLWRQCF